LAGALAGALLRRPGPRPASAPWPAPCFGALLVCWWNSGWWSAAAWAGP